MGLYDNISGKIKCPHCGQEFDVDLQIKWTNDCIMYDYHVGQEIDALDGEYSYATAVRQRLYDVCPNCKEDVNLIAIVKDGILRDIMVNPRLLEMVEYKTECNKKSKIVPLWFLIKQLAEIPCLVIIYNTETKKLELIDTECSDQVVYVFEGEYSDSLVNYYKDMYNNFKWRKVNE